MKDLDQDPFHHLTHPNRLFRMWPPGRLAWWRRERERRSHLGLAVESAAAASAVFFACATATGSSETHFAFSPVAAAGLALLTGVAWHAFGWWCWRATERSYQAFLRAVEDEERARL